MVKVFFEDYSLKKVQKQKKNLLLFKSFSFFALLNEDKNNLPLQVIMLQDVQKMTPDDSTKGFQLTFATSFCKIFSRDDKEQFATVFQAILKKHEYLLNIKFHRNSQGEVLAQYHTKVYLEIKEGKTPDYKQACKKLLQMPMFQFFLDDMIGVNALNDHIWFGSFKLVEKSYNNRAQLIESFKDKTINEKEVFGLLVSSK